MKNTIVCNSAICANYRERCTGVDVIFRALYLVGAFSMVTLCPLYVELTRCTLSLE
jgi:hypothetical protein